MGGKNDPQQKTLRLVTKAAQMTYWINIVILILEWFEGSVKKKITKPKNMAPDKSHLVVTIFYEMPATGNLEVSEPREGFHLHHAISKNALHLLL